MPGPTVRPRVLVISSWPVAGEVVGPAIRAYELARALVPHADVTLAASESDGEPPPGVRVVEYRYRSPGALRPLIAEADAIVSQPPPATIAGWMRRSGARLVFDLYDPEPLEALERYAEEPSRARRVELTFTLDRLENAMHLGDHFLCAGERQRDLWLGALLAHRLIAPEAYRADPTLDGVVGIVPFGIPERPAEASGPGPRATLAGLSDDDELVLWNGGIWPWLDAPAAIEAMALLGERRPRARLLFMGASSLPSARQAAADARRVAAERGLLDRSVFFNDTWVPYGERDAWLLDADCVVTAHHDHLETRFAFRTRLLDCLWARIPIVCTEGDELAELVRRDDLGAAIAAEDPGALADALDGVLARGKADYSERLAAAAGAYTWSRVAEPLVRFATGAEPRPPGGRRRSPRLGARLRQAAYRAVARPANALRKPRELAP